MILRGKMFKCLILGHKWSKTVWQKVLRWHPHTAESYIHCKVCYKDKLIAIKNLKYKGCKKCQ